MTGVSPASNSSRLDERANPAIQSNWQACTSTPLSQLVSVAKSLGVPESGSCGGAAAKNSPEFTPTWLTRHRESTGERNQSFDAWPRFQVWREFDRWLNGETSEKTFEENMLSPLLLAKRQGGGPGGIVETSNMPARFWADSYAEFSTAVIPIVMAQCLEPMRLAMLSRQ